MSLKRDSENSTAWGRDADSAHPSFVLARGRITPIAVVAGLVIMILALVYVALNRSHAVAPKAPIHQAR